MAGTLDWSPFMDGTEFGQCLLDVSRLCLQSPLGTPGMGGYPRLAEDRPPGLHTRIPPSHRQGPRQTLCEAPCHQRMLMAGFSTYLCSDWGPQACDTSWPHTQGLSQEYEGWG